jgi:uncharacterized protein (TIGR00106 family)
MSTCAISIVSKGPGTSVSHIVAKCVKILDNFPDLKWQLTPMSTQLEGATPRIFEALQAMHEVPFGEGVPRVYTVITIDDRRDKEQTLNGKVASVEAKLDL